MSDSSFNEMLIKSKNFWLGNKVACGRLQNYICTMTYDAFFVDVWKYSLFCVCYIIACKSLLTRTICEIVEDMCGVWWLSLISTALILPVIKLIFSNRSFHISVKKILPMTAQHTLRKFTKNFFFDGRRCEKLKSK